MTSKITRFPPPPPIVPLSDSDSDSDTQTSGVDLHTIVGQKPESSHRLWKISIALVAIGVLLAVGGNVMHQMNVIDMKTTLWFFTAGASTIFVAGCLSHVKKYLLSGGLFWLVSGALVCIGSDLTHATGAINSMTTLGLDSAGMLILTAGIISLYKCYKAAREKSKENLGQLLLFAVYQNDPAACERHLKAGAHPNYKNGLGTSTLNLAILNLTDGKTKKDAVEKIVKLLIEYGASPSYKDHEGNNLLHLAYQYDWSTLIPLLETKYPQLKNEKNKAYQKPSDFHGVKILQANFKPCISSLRQKIIGTHARPPSHHSRQPQRVLPPRK
jgi:hypothetical protein